jgi:hypothetical protein
VREKKKHMLKMMGLALLDIVFVCPSLKVDMNCGYERIINLWISH